MKDNKGFTLVELLAAIVIIGILAILAIPAFTQVYSSVRQSNRNAKIQEIEKAAEKYGSKIKDEVKNATNSSMALKYTDANGNHYSGAAALIVRGYLASDKDGDLVVIDPMYNRPLSADVYLTYCKSKYDIEANYLEKFDSKTVYFAGDKVGSASNLEGNYKGAAYMVNITYKPSRPYDASALQEGDIPCPTAETAKKAKNVESCRQRPTVKSLNDYKASDGTDLSIIKNSMDEPFFTPYEC